MPNTTANIVNITPPRVPLVDERTGLISREWYRFFLSLFVLTGSGANNTSLTDLQIGPPSATAEDIQRITPSEFGTTPSQDSAIDQIAELQKQVEALAVSPLSTWVLDQVAELQKQIDELKTTIPQPIAGASGSFTTVDLKTVTVVNGIIVSIV